MRIGSRASAKPAVGFVAVSLRGGFKGPSQRRQGSRSSGRLEENKVKTNLFESPFDFVPLRTCRGRASELRFLLLDPVLLQSVLP